MGRLAAIVIICVTASTAFGQYTLTTLASFDGTDGSNPAAGLVLSGGTLYGTTSGGNSSDNGNVFSLPTTGGTPTVLTSFDRTNGADPLGDLILIGSTLYGTASQGGTHDVDIGGDGTVFSESISGGAPTVLASLAGTNGDSPSAGLVVSGSTLYGTATGGTSLSHLFGVVFSVPLAGGSISDLAVFNGTSGGSFPESDLIISAGTLYGTTPGGGNENYGTVFSELTSGGHDNVLASFNGSDGNSPDGGLILSNGILYGATENGVFSVPIGGGTPTLLGPFNSSDGGQPEGDLILSNGILYGTTTSGGVYSDGEVFSVPITGGTPTVLYSFDGGDDGSDPRGGLVMDSSGNLYGTTYSGGESSAGTVFELSPVPEPGVLSLIGLSACGVLVRRRLRWQQLAVDG
jgi:uncharacterized repeat protein (TIGR03803 family)